MTPSLEIEAPKGRPDVVFRALVDEWVLFDPESRQLHVLNHTAALVWAFADGAHPTNAMVAELRALLDDAPSADVLAEHVREALDTFRRQGLLL